MELSKDLQNFVLNWGEMASHWGLNRTEAYIHSLLFICKRPLTMEEIADTLNVARSNVSNSLKELQNWKIVQLVSVMGDRRKHYVARKDVWEMFRCVVSEQRRREIDPFIQLLRETKENIGNKRTLSDEDVHAQEQVDAMLEFFEITMSWYSQLQGMKTSTVRKYLKLGNKVSQLLGKG